MIALHHTTSGRHRRAADDIDLRRGLGDSIAEKETNRFFHAQRPSRNPAVFESLRETLIGILVFLPGAYIRLLTPAVHDLLPCPPFFKCRAHIECLPFGGQHHREQSLAAPPANASEIIERRSFPQQEGIDPV